MSDEVAAEKCFTLKQFAFLRGSQQNKARGASLNMFQFGSVRGTNHWAERRWLSLFLSRDTGGIRFQYILLASRDVMGGLFMRKFASSALSLRLFLLRPI